MDEERVQYSFTGDVSSLRIAVQQAIDLLDKYQSKIDKSSSRAATFGNDKTASALNKASQAVGAIRNVVEKAQGAFSNLSNRMGQVRNAAREMQNSVSTATASISRIRDMSSPFSSVTTAMQSFAAKAAAALNALPTFANSVIAAFRRVQQTEEDAGVSADRLANHHTALGRALDWLRNLFKRETDSIEDEEEELDEKNDTLDRSTRGHRRLGQVLTSLGNLFSRESRSVSTFSGRLNIASQATHALRNAIGALTGLALGDWLAKSIKESIAYVENLNLFTVAMGDSIDMGLKFIDTMSEIYGMDPSNLYRYTGYFYQLTDAIGMADDASAVLSLSLTKASNDIASLFNVPIEQVVDNLASGMQGMSRAVRKYGMDIRATTLQETAAAYGLSEKVQNMSEANRMALRYLTMMNQVRNATQQVTTTTAGASTVMGDFARNIETPANQLRIFKEQITQLGRAIGNFFIPILRKVLPVINGVVMALRMMLQTIASLLGIDLNFGGSVAAGLADQADSIGAVGDAADGTSKSLKELRKTLAPFDELNVLQAPTEDSGGGSSGGSGGVGSDVLDPALAEAIKNTSLGLEDIKMKANEVRDNLLKFFGFDYVDVFNPETGEYEKKLQWFADRFEANLINKFPQWEKTITALFDNWTGIMTGFQHVFESLGGVVDKVKEKIKNFLDSLHLDDVFSEAIKALPDNLERLSDWIDEHTNGIANFILILGGVYAGFQAFQRISRFLAPLIRFGGIVAEVIGPAASLIGIFAAVAGAIALLYTNSDSFATAFKNLFQTILGTVQPIVESVIGLLQTLWTSIQQLWQEHLQPMVEAFGDMLAPVLDTLGVLWLTASTLIQGLISLIGDLWTGVVAPMLGALADGLAALMGIIQMLWEDVIGPVIENILNSLPDLFNNVISPIIKSVMEIIGGVIEIVIALWTEVLAPLITWLINTLGPSIRNIVNTIWDIVSSVVQSIAGIINGLLQIIRGIVDFVAGVFTGDWARAWQGVKEIFVGIINAIISAFELGINMIIGLVNSLISFVWSGVQAFVNSILSTVNAVAGALGFSVNLQWGSPPPAIGALSIPRVPMAQGGVVTGPTNALIGEGRYDEAVIPLGNSPQMNQFADDIAGKLNGAEQIALLKEQNDLLRQILQKTGVHIDGRDLTRIVDRHQRQTARATGG